MSKCIDREKGEGFAGEGRVKKGWEEDDARIICMKFTLKMM